MAKGATVAAGPQTRSKDAFTLTHAMAMSALLWLAALGAALRFGEGAWRPGFVAGVVTGALGGTIGFLLLARTMHANVSVALMGRLLGFMTRLMLIAGGLLVTIRVFHGEPMAFVFAFFPLFFISTGLEHLVASSNSSTGSPAPEASSGGSH